MRSKTVTVTVHREGSACFIPVPFNPKVTFGTMRAPVWVSLRGYRYQTTIVTMGDICCVPLRRSHREAAGISGGETLKVMFELDTAKREVEMPSELAEKLKSRQRLAATWRTLSYTRQREFAESIKLAKKPETRTKRVATIIAALAIKMRS